MDFVFTVCDNAAGEVCPIWPGKPMTAHWGMPDPAAFQGSEAQRLLPFRAAFNALQNRIRLFVNLPIASLERMKLKERVEVLGRKLSVISETAQALTDIIDTQRSLSLELIIALLIVFEILVTFYQIYSAHGGH